MGKAYQPVAQGRASIATWNLTVSFRTKKQAQKVVEGILSDEISWNFTYSEDSISEHDGVTRTIFTVSVEDMAWANNLQRLAAFIKAADYQDAD